MFSASVLASAVHVVAASTGWPHNILPGVSQVSAGVDITRGKITTAPSRAFAWTFKKNSTVQWKDKEYVYPDQLNPTPLSYCNWADAAGAGAATSYTEHMKNQARSFGASFDGTMDVGIALDPMLQGTMSFSQSDASADYDMHYKSGKTVAISSRVRARAWHIGLQVFDLMDNPDEVFESGFKHAAVMFSQNPTRKMAEFIWDQYGSHFIVTAELGGVAERSMFFESKTDVNTAQSYRHSQEDSSFSFLWFKGGQAENSTDTTKNADGSTSAIAIGSTTITGGDVHAKSHEDFCASVLDGIATPIVLDYTKLVPVWEFFFLFQEVNASAGDAMKKHFLNLTEEGRQCGTNSCQFPHSTCKYRHDRTWSKPCLNSDPEPYIELYKDGDCKHHLDVKVEGVGSYHGCSTCTGPYRWAEESIKCVIVGPGTVATLSDTFGSHNFGPIDLTPGIHGYLKFSPHSLKLKYQYFKPDSESAQHNVLI